MVQWCPTKNKRILHDLCIFDTFFSKALTQHLKLNDNEVMVQSWVFRVWEFSLFTQYGIIDIFQQVYSPFQFKLDNDV